MDGFDAGYGQTCLLKPINPCYSWCLSETGSGAVAEILSVVRCRALNRLVVALTVCYRVT